MEINFAIYPILILIPIPIPIPIPILLYKIQTVCVYKHTNTQTQREKRREERERYTIMPRFGVDMDGEMLQMFKEIAIKKRTKMTEIARDLLYNYVQEQTTTPVPRLSIISHGIGTTNTNTQNTERERKDLSPEDRKALLIKNLMQATNEALPTISDMDVDEFAKEIRTPIIDKIFKHRHTKYRNKEQHTRSLVPLQLGIKEESY